MIYRPCRALSLAAVLLSGCAAYDPVAYPGERTPPAREVIHMSETTKPALDAVAAPPPQQLSRRESVVTPKPTPRATPKPTPKPKPTPSPRAPFAVPVPDKPGYVTLLGLPDAIIDVRGLPKDTEARDPVSGRLFLVP